MATLPSFVSWRVVAILLALINLKSLPLAWHFRLFYRMFANWSSRTRVATLLKDHEASGNATHPLFQSVSIFSRSPLLETDYNLHKSNSTYFGDLDESRTALVTKLILPGFRQGEKNLEKEGHKGRLNVILGSVHTSFHREIKPYELYEVRSRVLGWDKKWLVIGSFFIRPASKGKEEVLLASALSKYVVKKGRFTVAPERCFTTAGWLPARPENSNARPSQTDDSSRASGTPAQTGSAESSQSLTSYTATPDGIAAPIPESAVEVTAAVVEKLESAAEATSSSHDLASDPLLPLTKADKVGAWDWHRIDMERLRGLQIAANWLDLDKDLLGEFSRR